MLHYIEKIGHIISPKNKVIPMNPGNKDYDEFLVLQSRGEADLERISQNDIIHIPRPSDIKFIELIEAFKLKGGMLTDEMQRWYTWYKEQ